MTLEELRKGLTRIAAAMAPLEAELSAADNPKIVLDATLVRELRADPGHAALLQGWRCTSSESGSTTSSIA